MSFASVADRDAIENEMSWADRNVPATLYQQLSKTAATFPDRPAVSYQLTSGPTDPAETVTWQQLLERSCQAANVFRGLGIGEDDVIAYVLPNALETVYTLLGGAIAGVVAPINPLLEPEQIGAILRETGAKVVVTLKPFPKTDVPQKVAEAVRHAPGVHTVLEIDLNRYLSPPKSWIVPLVRPKNPNTHHAKVMNFNSEIAKQNKTLDFADSKVDRVAAYFHTGGTTGTPKLAQHTHFNEVFDGWIFVVQLVGITQPLDGYFALAGATPLTKHLVEPDSVRAIHTGYVCQSITGELFGELGEIGHHGLAKTKSYRTSIFLVDHLLNPAREPYLGTTLAIGGLM